MKRIHIGLLFALLCSAVVAASDAERTIEKQFNVKAGGKLNLDLTTGGSVEIRGWNKDQVVVKAFLAGDDWEDCRVDIAQSGGDVNVESHYAGRRQSYSTSMSFNVMVPEKFDIELDSSGGELSVKNLMGSIEGATGGGEIQISGARGSIHLATGGGEINIAHSQLDGEVSTGGGDILFDEVEGNLVGTSGSGQVIRTGKSSHHGRTIGKKIDTDLEVTKAGGEVEIDDAPNGARISTGGGDIRIRSAQRFVEAQTGGGDIQMDDVKGAVEATTGAGNIHVRITGSAKNGEGDIKLSSGTGDITLFVPAGFSMELLAEIGYTHERDDFNIESDFPISLKRKDEWSTREGTARKYIIGTYTAAGGKNRVRIKTVNGSITVRKS
jgi:DUF4097 and DUF4098 domain-containing protein YvlB